MEQNFALELKKAISRHKINKNIPDLEFLHHLFSNLDFEKRGICSFVEFENVLSKLKVKGKFSIKQLFSKFDKGEKGKIRYLTFCKYFLLPSSKPTVKKVSTIDDPSVDKFVDYLLSISLNAYLNLYKEFLYHDNNLSNQIRVEEFSLILKENRVKLNIKDCQRIFHLFEQKGEFKYTEFFHSINVKI